MTKLRLLPALLIGGALLVGGVAGCASEPTADPGSGATVTTAVGTSGETGVETSAETGTETSAETGSETSAGTGSETAAGTGGGTVDPGPAGGTSPTGHESIGEVIAFRQLDVIDVPAGATDREITANDQYYELEKLLGVTDSEPLNTIPDDHRRFAFVLSGCEEYSAMVRLDGTTLRAELIGDDSIDCVRAVHYLALFDVPTDALGPQVTVGD